MPAFYGMLRARPTACPCRCASAPVERSIPQTAAPVLVKVCGVTNVKDAEVAAQRGADMIGMIMWPHAKRSVGDEAAAAIAAVARENGAQPVGVFVDEDAGTIARRCAAAGLHFAQLHGDAARAALFDLPPSLGVIYVMHATPDGVCQTPAPSALALELGRQQRKVDYVLLDSLKGGSGVAFDWQAVQAPRNESTLGWLLAGGLTAETVALAVTTASPTGVDVSSGVCGPDGLQKDHAAVQSFVQNAKQAFGSEAVSHVA